MSSFVPQALAELIEALAQLPGVGTRSAERYAYYLFKSSPQKSQKIENSLKELHTKLKYCPISFALISSDQDTSPLYSSPERDKTLIAVVADPFDIMALESTGAFKGTYHSLGGLISPIDNISPDQLHIAELIARVRNDKVKELIYATNTSVESETTLLYIIQALDNTKIKITRLARGLPVGAELEYTDQITLTSALEGRQSV